MHDLRIFRIFRELSFEDPEIQISFFPVEFAETDLVAFQFFAVEQPVIENPAEPGMAQEGLLIGNGIAEF